LSGGDLLARGIRQLGLSMEPSEVDRLAAYAAQIEVWNPGLGLVGATGDELIIKHLLDSLAGVPFFATLPPGALLLDVGSGAGLPGIPLAIALPRISVVLLDRSDRRATFLEHCVGLLELRNATVHRGEARTFGARVDAVTLRAVAPLSVRFLKRSGLPDRSDLLAAYKGTWKNAKAEADAVASIYPESGILPLVVPFLEAERHLLVLRR
jgi:16S rRNA (guanine527-N7)-methyltransferase